MNFSICSALRSRYTRIDHLGYIESPPANAVECALRRVTHSRFSIFRRILALPDSTRRQPASRPSRLALLRRAALVGCPSNIPRIQRCLNPRLKRTECDAERVAIGQVARYRGKAAKKARVQASPR